MRSPIQFKQWRQQFDQRRRKQGCSQDNDENEDFKWQPLQVMKDGFKLAHLFLW
ncbi:MAG: hypothetical protein K9N47_06100 [Prosthecobacter sp.]|uniref:hypothetical protein n=1 Tax=Prosthecobacter sp. TaxID=1965333 RepID=UPI0025D0A026|nr:hypothetical protein [Prosthecobacter sp.]MCF7785673.1 hypothetical protein [Prosthecobacter sp.]